MFQTAKSILYQMPDFIGIPGHIFIFLFPVFFKGNIGFRASFLYLLPESVLIIALIRIHKLGSSKFDVIKQLRCNADIVDIACSNDNLNRVT